jgi:hypothetical protein
MKRSRDSSVGIATSYGLDDQGVGPGKVKNFLFSKSSRSTLRSTQPPIQWVPGALSPGGKAASAPGEHHPNTNVTAMSTCSVKGVLKSLVFNVPGYPMETANFGFQEPSIC